jgi:flagellar hook protein FlgE
MNALPSIAVSGLHAAQARLSVAAHNVANAATPGFRRQQIVASADAGGGVTTAVARATQAGPALERDMVDQLQARHEFAANLAVFRTADRMTGTLLDAIG